MVASGGVCGEGAVCPEGWTKGARHPYPPSTPLIPFTESERAAELPRFAFLVKAYVGRGEKRVESSAADF